jgi:hypothetical protein
MARVIDKLPDSRRPGRPSLYPWDEWADGRAWVALAGEDYKTKHGGFRSAVMSEAKRRAMHCSTRAVYEGDEQIGVAFQFSRNGATS